MASTPLYKPLKSKGTSFYAFPGAAEDISAAYQNSNYKMYFSKFALLNIPKRNLTPGTQSNPVRFDFGNSFYRSVNATDVPSFSDAVVESLRNYVANQETVIRESRLNDSQYYYDTNALETATEKIFWKWCKKLNIIDFEPAIPEEEYFSGISEFAERNLNDDSYFPEYLWKEREVVNWDTVRFSPSAESGYNNLLEVEFDGETNFRVGDTVVIYDVTDNSVISTLPGIETQEGIQVQVVKLIDSTATTGQRVIFNKLVNSLIATSVSDGQAELVYHRLVQYIGEISGISNVAEANRSYTEVYAHIPDHVGQTPDVLFRTTYDINYRPGLTFPILASQIQPEILGAENFSSPIVSAPQNYPGSHYAQFDTLDFTYETSTGDVLRRSGRYYGILGDVNSPVVDVSGLDGISMDFNTSHYVKMNIANRVVTNFEQFSGMMLDNLAPNDFEFNSILWYYTVEDANGDSRTNLYGISFLDNPMNNVMVGETGLRFPTYSKLVANGKQDGTSFAFNLNLNFNILNDNVQEAYNPEAINSLFSMERFNEAMRKLSFTNDSFTNIIAEQGKVRDEIQNLKGLLYSQNDISVINTKIANLELLLRLYSSSQIVSSESIRVSQRQGTPPTIILDSVERTYSRVENIETTTLYGSQGSIPGTVVVPEGKSLLINVLNNDATEMALPAGDRLSIVLSRDLDYRQNIEFSIRASDFSTQNKKLDIFVISDIGGSVPTEVLLVGNIDLPVFYNPDATSLNSAAKWKSFGFGIDFSSAITIFDGPVLELTIDSNPHIVANSIKVGDVVKIDDLFVGTSSVYDFSGQYRISSSGDSGSSKIRLDVSNNPSLVDYASANSSSLPLAIHGSTFSMLSNLPKIDLNKGMKISVTRVQDSSVSISERYKVDMIHY